MAKQFELDIPDEIFDKAPVDDGPSLAERLMLDLDGFEGPLDLLLELARDQKVDIIRISILELAEQYLNFINTARELRLELAADYLVMAAWLAYLKSRLLLPKQDSDEEELSAEEMAEILAFQLKRLEAMKAAGEELLERPNLGRDFFGRGDPEEVRVTTASVYGASLYDLLKAYAQIMLTSESKTLEIEAFDLYAMDDAIRRLRDLFGRRVVPTWTKLLEFMPHGLGTPLKARSALAAHFVASLEMCRDGELEISQEQVFGPIMLRSPQKRRDPELDITSGDYSDMDKLGAKSGAGMDNNGD
ncbi:segregation and condensation protein A [Thalassospira xiamenensis]|uniref:Segregation and condensation protein A n=1 Tax=Thalassospira xiamenensis TaxID=220697 RepID=A0A367WVU4_9PROT|nr:ScpA family protein [Thalassospira xiamenensis]KZB53878.1 chromosome segregation protein ScpA [Thalassospira xiamenensis]RCK45584.1 chromosome segregation protein ScpA [Thalassospira xiamenensis]